MNAREIAIVIFVSKTRHECKKSSLTRSQVAHLFPVVISESFSYISSRRNFLFLYFDGLFFFTVELQFWNIFTRTFIPVFIPETE